MLNEREERVEIRHSFNLECGGDLSSLVNCPTRWSLYCPLGIRIRLKFENRIVCISLVNCPTRWSLSSSWRWQPHIGLCRLLRPLLRAGMTVLTQFFCKMYFLYVLASRKKNWDRFFSVFPPERAVFFRRGSLTSRFVKIEVVPAEQPHFWQSAA